MKKYTTTVVFAAAALVGGLVGGAGVAVANHVFPDSTNGQAFHDQVANIAAAGCATGFPDGTFRPKDEVNRQQFAAWMNRCGTRVGFDYGEQTPLPENDSETIAEVDLRTGGATGGTGFLVALGSARWSGGDDCPCQLQTFVSGAQLGFSPIEHNTFTVFPADGEQVESTVFGVVPVDTAEDVNVTLNGRFTDDNENQLLADGKLVVFFVPFGPQGTDGL